MSLCAMEALLFQAALNFFVGARAATGGKWSLKAPHQGGVIPYCRSMSELYEQTELTADLTAYCRRNGTYENRVYTLLQINENARRAHIRFVPFAIPPLTPPWSNQLNDLCQTNDMSDLTESITGFS